VTCKTILRTIKSQTHMKRLRKNITISGNVGVNTQLWARLVGELWGGGRGHKKLAPTIGAAAGTGAANKIKTGRRNQRLAAC